MRCIFQLMDKETGERSPIMVATRREFANQLALSDNPRKEFTAVIVLMHEFEDEFDFVDCPLIDADIFVKSYGDACHAGEVLSTAVDSECTDPLLSGSASGD